MYLYFQAPSPYHGFPVVALTLYFPDLAFSYLFHGTGPKITFCSFWFILFYYSLCFSFVQCFISHRKGTITMWQLQCNNYNNLFSEQKKLIKDVKNNHDALFVDNFLGVVFSYGELFSRRQFSEVNIF